MPSAIARATLPQAPEFASSALLISLIASEFGPANLDLSLK